MPRSAPATMALVVMLALPLGSPMASEIYRHVDENGNVTFSDEPQEDDSEAMELESLPEVNLSEPTQRRERSRSDAREDDGDESDEAQGYQNIEITAPEHDSAFWRGDGLVVVRFQSEPSLRSGHRYALELDGEKVNESRSNSFTLENMDRGTHELVVHIVNADGETVSSSEVTRFTLHRPSQLN